MNAGIQKWKVVLSSLILLALALTACGGGAVQTVVVTEVVEGQPVEVVVTVPAETSSGRHSPDAAGDVVERSGSEFAATEESIYTVPDQRFEVSLNAGEIDDNADFEAYLQYRLDFERFLGGSIATEKADVSERHTIAVTGSDGLPILGADVLIYNEQSLVTALRTRADGLAYFFPRAYPSAGGATRFTVAVGKGGLNTEFGLARDGASERWPVLLSTAQDKQQVQLDVLFLIDSTGSMSPQIEQLKDNIISISGQIEALPGNPNTRYGMVAYRDHGDVYITRISDFSANVRSFQRDLNGIQAGGGGDTPEAMNEGLHRALHDVSWRGQGTISLVILVADAPPHLDYAQDYSYAEEMQYAASMGIAIFPIMADTGVSGAERDQAEYILRQIAQFSGGHFVFVTSEDTPKSSGEEGADLSVQEDAYTVENLDALVVRLIRQQIEALLGQ